MEANRIVPSGICASIEPSEYSEYAIPSTMPDLSTVTDGSPSLRAADTLVSGSASVNVDGARPVRRGKGAPVTFIRSDLGQASSNVDDGFSPDSAGCGSTG